MKIRKILALTTASALVLAAMPLCASAEDELVYLEMNIPYNVFYADLNNDVEVDTVTSATSSKWAAQSGTYYTALETGGEILGVTFPVAVSQDVFSQLTEYDDSSADYYYTVLDETPSVYMELTLGTDGTYEFSDVQGSESELSGVTASFSTSSNYGDYQINLTDLSLDGTVYGVIIATTDGTEYGLRHLENIWRSGSQLSWSSGISTTESHGNTLSYEHYASIMGKTISGIEFITSSGIYTLDYSQYVQIKTDVSVTVEDASVESGTTTFTLSDSLPSDYDVTYYIDGLEASFSSSGEIEFDTSAVVGSYTFTVTDIQGIYADITTTFTLTTDDIPAAYDSDSVALVAADGYDSDDLATYISNISSVTVDGTSYSASGKRSVQIISSDGSIDTSATSTQGDSIFTSGTHEVTVSATGYANDLTFTVVIGDEEIVYVTMNIPYSVFYENLNNDVEVDTVSSATDTKWLKFEGAYTSEAAEDGSGEIYGVKFAVAMTASTYEQLTEVTDSTAAYYYELLDEEPAVYKTLTIVDGEYVFSDVEGTVTDYDTTVTIADTSTWGDYQISLESFSLADDEYICAVVITTESGLQYGLRHLENIWLNVTEYSWSTGFKTTEAKGNTLSYEHYVSMMGETISNISIITNMAIYSIDTSLYVTVKTGIEAAVEDAAVDAGSTSVTLSDTLPSDFDAVYSVDGLETTYSDGVLYFETASAGSYTLTISDSNGIYADITADFILSTDTLPVEYDSASRAIVAADGYDSDDLLAYLANISTVTVDDTSYSATGRRSTVIISTSDGSIDLTLTDSDGNLLFAEGNSYEFVVSADGYPDLTFTLDLTTTSDDDMDSDTSTDTDDDTDSDTSTGTDDDTDSDTSSDTDTDSTGSSTSDVTGGILLVVLAAAAISLALTFTLTKKRKSE